MTNTCGKARDFFGVIQRIYTIFANSTKRWEIFKVADSVKAIRFQVSEIREALLQVADNDNDSKIRSEAKSLAQNELGDFEFLVSIVIWYEVLYAINIVSKHLQSKDMLIDVAIEKIKGMISFFKGYRETGFLSALEIATNIAIKNDINPNFSQRRVIRRKKYFDENENDTSEVAPQTAEESFKTKYFLFVVDQAIMSLTTRFEQYQEYENRFGFLFTSQKLLSLDDVHLKSSCSHIETFLRKHENADIDANELYMVLKLLQNFLPKRMIQPIDILKYLKLMDCFPNAIIVYRILLTIHVTVASAERSFSKLKLLKSYMRSTMTQEMLNGLAMIAIENNLLEEIDHEKSIEDFISNNTRRMLLFK